MSKKGDLMSLNIRMIETNTDNPRLIFDQEKLDDLISSIKSRGEILVPISVFLNKNKKYTIIDGERRYRAALKLGMSEIPVTIRKNPHEDYVHDMFHIHHMREQWELVPTSLKLEEVIVFFQEKHKKEPTEDELIKLTGLTRSEVRRCKIILQFPKPIQNIILNEEAKTSKERGLIGKDKLLTEDFFIEVSKNLINPLKQNNKKLYRELKEDKGIFDNLIKKRRQGKISNIVSLRPICRYIRENPRKSMINLKKFILKEDYSLGNLLSDTGLEFDPYNFERNLKIFSGALSNLPEEMEESLKKKVASNLREIRKIITEKLKSLK